MIEVHEVDVQLLPGCPGHILWRAISPAVAVALGEVDHPLELGWRNGPVRNLVDSALEAELLLELRNVPVVARPLKWELRHTFHLRLDHGGPSPCLLRTDQGHVRAEVDDTGPPLPLGLREAQEDVVVTAAHVVIDYVDLPPGPHSHLFRLAVDTLDDGALKFESVLAARMPELKSGHGIDIEARLRMARFPEAQRICAPRCGLLKATTAC
mmetsp:Transcript_65776/g.140741  ORF Transcript_65776/g.140741 Transcript_65776/m.140741 type:complete len:211 (-) Transcript_65776:139-771(-)